MSIEYYHVDEHGNCLGYFDTVGHYFDPAGQYRGALSHDGHLCDHDGTACGRVDTRGQVWDAEGSYRGYLLDAKGHGGPGMPQARSYGACRHGPPDTLATYEARGFDEA